MNAKAILRIFTVVTLALCTVSMPLDAKTTRRTKKARTTASAGVRKGAVTEYGDYLKMQTFTLKRGQSEYTVQYPVSGNEALVNAIRKWVQRAIYEKYTGSLETPDGFMQKSMRSLDSFETLTQTVKVLYHNDNVITMYIEGYLYTGGAHGMPFAAGTTFMVNSGKPLELSMIGNFNNYVPYIRKALAKYTEMSESEMRDNGIGNEIPETTPYVTSEGLCFQYGAYEIGPYAIGEPALTVPADVARKLMPASGAAYLK